MNMNILISGFGQMGCRHAQSLLTSNDDYSIYVIEPSDEAFETGLSTIGASKKDFTRHLKFEELNAPIDLAISATCSKPRYSILLDLIEYGIKYFLLEKVVFQSLKQFDIIIEKLESEIDRLKLEIFELKGELKITKGQLKEATLELQKQQGYYDDDGNYVE